jgi:hypothetical protein
LWWLVEGLVDMIMAVEVALAGIKQAQRNPSILELPIRSRLVEVVRVVQAHLLMVLIQFLGQQHLLVVGAAAQD